MSERKWTSEEEEMIAKVIMSPYGKQELRKIIQKTGAEFADSQPPGSMGEVIGRMVAGLPVRKLLNRIISEAKEKESYNGN